MAHLYPTYVPGHDADLHGELLGRSLCGSILVTKQLVDNGLTPHPQTYWLERSDAQPQPAAWLSKVRRKLTAASTRARFEDFAGRKLMEHHVGLLHVHFGTFAVELLEWLDRQPMPLVVTLYGVDASAALQDPAILAGYRRLYRRADRVVVLSDVVRERLQRTGCPAERIAVWDMPLDFDPFPYREPRPGATVKLLTAARFVEKKGYPVLLQALALLRQRGLAATLTAIGYGPLEGDIRDRVRQLGLERQVTIVDTSAHRGFSALYGEALAAHDIFVLPSTQARNGDDEGGPALTLVMAQAAGLPVVCTPFAGSERSVTDGETGLLCEPDNPAALADKLAFLMSRRDLWSSLAEAASRGVRQRFDKKQQVDAVADMYRSLLH